MAATLLRVDPAHPDSAVIAQAAAAIARGDLVAFPTETVYGLGADATNPDAVARIYAAKGRPAWNPLIAHVADVASAQALASHWPQHADRLAERFWPGPLTLVVPKNGRVPDVATAGLPAVAVRVPSHPVALALLRAARTPIAAPSANRFTQVSPTTADHVRTSLGDRIPLILDGGACEVGIESTVVDLTQATPRVLRPGMISRIELERALGVEVDVHSATVRADDVQAAAQLAPGMGDRHYAPRADVWLYEPDRAEEIVRALREWRSGHGQSADGSPTTQQLVALLRSDSLAEVAVNERIPMPDSPAEYARALYAALHRADAIGAALVVIELPPETESWQGVRDRLARAAR